MLKKITGLLIISLIFIITSCDSNIHYSDGTISVTLTGLDQLTGFTLNSSNIYCLAKSKSGDSYKEISTSYFPHVNSNSLSFSIGNPDYIFDGGDLYLIEILVDIDGNDSFEDLGTDYWHEVYEPVIINGDISVSIDNTDLILRQ